MITKNSIDLTLCDAECCGLSKRKGERTCVVLCTEEPKCSTECPFYKPKGCHDWIKIEDSDGINLIPPEEYQKAVEKSRPTGKAKTWRMCRAEK